MEKICEECGVTFEAEDSVETVCLECWEKIVGSMLDEEGEGEGE